MSPRRAGPRLVRHVAQDGGSGWTTVPVTLGPADAPTERVAAIAVIAGAPVPAIASTGGVGVQP